MKKILQLLKKKKINNWIEFQNKLFSLSNNNKNIKQINTFTFYKNSNVKSKMDVTKMYRNYRLLKND